LLQLLRAFLAWLHTMVFWRRDPASDVTVVKYNNTAFFSLSFFWIFLSTSSVLEKEINGFNLFF